MQIYKIIIIMVVQHAINYQQKALWVVYT